MLVVSGLSWRRRMLRTPHRPDLSEQKDRDDSRLQLADVPVEVVNLSFLGFLLGFLIGGK